MRISTYIVIVAIAIVVFGGCSVAISAYHRVDPGYVGIVVDYGKSTASGEPIVNVAETGIIYWIFPGELKRWQTYPVSQQTYVMVRSEKEGKVVGDDSVECRGHDGIPVNVDSRLWWRVQEKNAGKLYLLKPGVPLVGNGESDIEDTLVRPAIRGAIVDACSFFTYDELYGAKRLEFGDKVTTILKEKYLDKVYIQLDSFLLGEVYLRPEQSAAISKVAAAQQAAKEAAFLKEKAENEAKGVIAKAEGDKQAKILAAQADAEAIRVVNEQLGKSSYYIAFQYAQKWNGAYPTTVVLSNGQTLPIFAGLDLAKLSEQPVPAFTPLPMPTATVTQVTPTPSR